VLLLLLLLLDKTLSSIRRRAFLRELQLFVSASGGHWARA